MRCSFVLLQMFTIERVRYGQMKLKKTGGKTVWVTDSKGEYKDAYAEMEQQASFPRAAPCSPSLPHLLAHCSCR